MSNPEDYPKIPTRLKLQASPHFDEAVKTLMSLDTREAMLRSARSSGRTPRVSFYTVRSKDLDLGPSPDSWGQDSDDDEALIIKIDKARNHAFQLNKAMTLEDDAENDYVTIGAGLNLAGSEQKLIMVKPLFLPSDLTSTVELFTRIPRKNSLGGSALLRAFDALEDTMATHSIGDMAPWNMQVRNVEVHHEWPKLRPVPSGQSIDN